MKLFRIASQKYPVFSAVGSLLYGGRWNSPGREVIYMATSMAGAKLEMLAHNAGFDGLPKGFGYVEVIVPDQTKIKRYPTRRIPKIENSKAWGDAWLETRDTVIAVVPSKASPGDWNALLNPNHPEFNLLKVSREMPVRWDARHFRETIPLPFNGNK